MTFIAYLLAGFLLTILFISDLNDSPNGEGSENDYGTYYDGCTDPFISC